MNKQVIYIIFVLAYLGYTFYKKSQKKATVNRPQTTDDSQQPIENTSKPTSTKSMLEKMLLGEEFFEAPKTLDSEERRVMSEEGKAVSSQQSAVSSQQLAVNNEQLTMNNKKKKEEINLTEIMHQHQNTFQKFNLRQAMIYSIILERPYK